MVNCAKLEFMRYAQDPKRLKIGIGEETHYGPRDIDTLPEAQQGDLPAWALSSTPRASAYRSHKVLLEASTECSLDLVSVEVDGIFGTLGLRS